MTGRRLCGQTARAPAAVALLVAMHATGASAASRDFSYCGFGFAQATTAIAKPGGTLTTFFDRRYRDSYPFIETVGSTTTLEWHDRIGFGDIDPGSLRLQRVDDDLVVCGDEMRFELVIAAHYCRGQVDSADSIPNGEIEEFIFSQAGEIWLSDGLYDIAMADPARAAASRAGFLYEGRGVSEWRVRPFREVMPELGRPVEIVCPALRLPDR